MRASVGFTEQQVHFAAHAQAQAATRAAETRLEQLANRLRVHGHGVGLHAEEGERNTT